VRTALHAHACPCASRISYMSRVQSCMLARTINTPLQLIYD